MYAAMGDVCCVAPAAIVDHVAAAASAGFITSVLGTEGLHGSRRVSENEIAGLLQQVYAHIPDVVVRPAGSVPNVARTLARMRRGAVKLLTACGSDTNGTLFLEDMKAAGVDVSRVMRRTGPTGTCLVLSSGSTRTMRTFISPNCRLLPHDLHAGLFMGSSFPGQSEGHHQQGEAGTPPAVHLQHQPQAAPQTTQQQGHGSPEFPLQQSQGWVFTSAYTLNTEGLLPTIIDLARQSGRRVVLDCASHELVSTHHSALRALLAQGSIDVCICNEDEARQLGQVCQHDQVSAPPPDSLKQELGSLLPSVWAATAYLSTCCKTAAIVTLGHKGCLVAEPRGKGQQQVGCFFYPALHVQAVDSTGAGDAFAAGFVAGLCEAEPLSKCARIASAAGAAAVQVVGSDLSPVWDFFCLKCSDV